MPQTSSLDQFSYRPEFIQPGTVYHYIKSNIDGTYPARIIIYVADHDHLEVWKFEEHSMDAALVKAHMDWTTFSADQLESWVVTRDSNRRPQASLSSSYEDKTFTISWQGRDDVIKVEHYPVHMYNFDFISLNYILHHWTKPEGEVTIGVLQPNFDPDPQTMMKYEGTVSIQYLEEEERNEQRCRKYSIGGEGLKGCSGTMWVNKESAYIQDMEIPIADNPDWENFKFRLTGIEYMNPAQWLAFTETETKKLKA